MLVVIVKDLVDFSFFNFFFSEDVKKMPLGKLSKTQIAKGFEVLENIELELNKKSPNNKNINELSSKFYTVIPQDFGRSVPKPISTTTFLQEKYDMLIVLSDIEMAQSLKENNSVKIEAVSVTVHNQRRKIKPPIKCFFLNRIQSRQTFWISTMKVSSVN